jgi:hypothetical protein
MADLHPAYRAIVLDQQVQLRKLVSSAGVAPIKSLYQDMLDQLAERLKVTQSETFTHQQLTGLMAQVKLGLVQLQRPVNDAFADAAGDVGVASARTALEGAARLERRFAGAVMPLPLLEIGGLRGLVQGRTSSLLRVNERSMARFGAQLTGRIETELASSLSLGENYSQAIDRVQDVGDLEFYRAERIVRCLPGDAVVTGAVVRAVHRRWHQGAMVKVVTDNGRNLTATPNHPVLTNRGWVGTGSLKHGDYLIRDAIHEGPRPARYEDVASRPTTIREVFDAVATVGVLERRPGTKPDFHGDGGDGEVDVAYPDRELMYGVFSPLLKPASKYLFSPSDVLSGGLGFCTRCAGLLPHERACRCLGSDRHPSPLEALVYKAVIHAHGGADLENGFSRCISRNRLIERKFDSVLRSISTGYAGAMGLFGAARYPRLPYVDANASGGDAESRGDFSATQSREIKGDRVIDLICFEFSGHVYNITTPDGYFYSNGYVVGNTELSYASGVSARGAIEEQAVELDGDLWMRWSEHVSDDGQPLDDRVGVDSEAMNGQVAPPGGMFTQPPVSPDGDIVQAGLVGQSWAAPPNRPNDRAVLVPWRYSWGVPGWQWDGGQRVPVTESGAEQTNSSWMRGRSAVPELWTKPAPPPSVAKKPAQIFAPRDEEPDVEEEDDTPDEAPKPGFRIGFGRVDGETEDDETMWLGDQRDALERLRKRVADQLDKPAEPAAAPVQPVPAGPMRPLVPSWYEKFEYNGEPWYRNTRTGLAYSERDIRDGWVGVWNKPIEEGLVDELGNDIAQPGLMTRVGRRVSGFVSRVLGRSPKP